MCGLPVADCISSFFPPGQNVLSLLDWLRFMSEDAIFTLGMAFPQERGISSRLFSSSCVEEYGLGFAEGLGGEG
jgi:hypothetical protein